MSRAWREIVTEGAADSGRSALLLGAYLAQPSRLRRLQQVLVALLLLWSCVSVGQLLWSLLPTPTQPAIPASELLNPVQRTVSRAPPPSVDIERAVSWHLFGEPGAELASAAEARLEAQRGADLPPVGIEDNARETRLALVLRGVVSSDVDGMGYAMIESRSQQDLYAVGDELPAGSGVALAKVLRSRVVLDNNGTYELLTLFDGDDAGLRAVPERARATGRRVVAARARQSEDADERSAVGERGTDLATQYRDRLYADPESLAEVVRVAAVREGDALLGYRVSPGRAQADFTALGFEAGDIVTAVNGLPLSDPANTVTLYQAMRDAQEAVFAIRRGDRDLTLSVSLAASGDDQ